MARLKAAGLNPNLIYGTGTQTGQSSSSAPSAKPAKWQPMQIGIDFMERMARIANINADTSATRTGEKYTGARTEGQHLKNEELRVIADWAKSGKLKKSMESQLGYVINKSNESRWRRDLIEAQTELSKNKVLLTKIGLNNSDNVILRTLGTWGAKNPIEAANAIMTLTQILDLR